MTLRQKQDTATQKRTGGEELDTKGKIPYLEGTMTKKIKINLASENAPTLTSSWRGPTLPKR
jgi:hypothetical protein